MSNTNTNTNTKALDVLQHGLELCHQASVMLGVNVLDNYEYRKLAMVDILKSIHPTMVPSGSRSRYSGSVGDKTVTLKTVTYAERIHADGTSVFNTSDLGYSEFDKILCEDRWNEVMNYDMYGFSVFPQNSAMPLVTVLIHKEEGVRVLREYMNTKLCSKLAKNKAKVASGKRLGRDSIQLSNSEILSIMKSNQVDCFIGKSRVTVDELIRRLKTNDIIK